MVRATLDMSSGRGTGDDDDDDDAYKLLLLISLPTCNDPAGVLVNTVATAVPSRPAADTTGNGMGRCNAASAV